jgi:hypothetical protein
VFARILKHGPASNAESSIFRLHFQAIKHIFEVRRLGLEGDTALGFKREPGKNFASVSFLVYLKYLALPSATLQHQIP